MRLKMTEKTENIETAIDDIESLVEQLENNEANPVENFPQSKQVTKSHAQKHRKLAEPH